VETVEPPRGGGATLDRETLAAMLDEKLSRREVKDIQSGYKDPDRFEKWVTVLQERVPYDEPILPLMGRLNCRAPRRPRSRRRGGGGHW
jgi:acetone carboxylase gamma subunit